MAIIKKRTYVGGAVEKWNSSTLLVGIQNDIATVESNMEALQKTKSGAAIWSGNTTSGCLSKRIESGSQGDVCVSIFIAVLFTVAGTGNSLGVYWWMNGKRNVVYTYNGVFFSL